MLHAHKAHHNTITHNFVNSENTSLPGSTNNTIEHNTLVEGNQWPQEAFEIMNRAGLEDEYQDLLPASANIQFDNLELITEETVSEFGVRINQVRGISKDTELQYFIDGGEHLADLVIEYGEDGQTVTTDEEGRALLGEPVTLADIPDLGTSQGVTIPLRLSAPSGFHQITFGLNIPGENVTLADEVGVLINLTGQHPVFEEDFEADEIGQTPEGWEYNADLGQATIAERENADGELTKVLQVEKKKIPPKALC